MSPERYYFVSLRIMQQQSGNFYAPVDTVFSHEWQAIGEEDFALLMRDCSFEKKPWENDIVQDIYKRTRDAAIDQSTSVSDSQAAMPAGGATPARLCRLGCRVGPLVSECRSRLQDRNLDICGVVRLWPFANGSKAAVEESLWIFISSKDP